MGPSGFSGSSGGVTGGVGGATDSGVSGATDFLFCWCYRIGVSGGSGVDAARTAADGGLAGSGAGSSVLCSSNFPCV